MLRLLQILFAVLFAGFPIVGVLFLSWDLQQTVLLYWVENLIIGFWQLSKLACAVSAPPGKRLFTGLFFLIHYGLFCVAHGTLILEITSSQSNQPADLLPTVLALPAGVLSAIGASFIMHGIDTLRVYFLSGNYKNAKPSKLMGEPYKHIIILHVAIIAAGGLILLFPSALPLLVLVAVGKLALDLKSLKPNRESHSS